MDYISAVGYGSIEFDDDMKSTMTTKDHRSITAFDGNQVVEMKKRDSIEVINSIVNDDDDDELKPVKKRKSNVIFEDAEVDEIIVLEEEYEAWKPQRLYTYDGDEAIDDDDEILKNQKVALPLPAMEEVSIHDIMQDDIMKSKKRDSYLPKKAGYRYIEHSGDFDNDLLLMNVQAAMESNNEDIFSDHE